MLLTSVLSLASVLIDNYKHINCIHVRVYYVMCNLIADMFCELGFNQHLDRDDESEINLPVPVGENKEAGRAEKKLFAELEVRFHQANKCTCVPTIKLCTLNVILCPFRQTTFSHGKPKELKKTNQREAMLLGNRHQTMSSRVPSLVEPVPGSQTHFIRIFFSCCSFIYCTLHCCLIHHCNYIFF